MPQGASSSQGASMATSMDVDGSAGGGTGDSSLQRSAAVKAVASFGRPIASASRGRPNIIGRTRPAAEVLGTFRLGVQEAVPPAGLGRVDELGHPRVEVALPLAELDQVVAGSSLLLATHE
jgi:hypothetical protein